MTCCFYPTNKAALSLAASRCQPSLTSPAVAAVTCVRGTWPCHRPRLQPCRAVDVAAALVIGFLPWRGCSQGGFYGTGEPAVSKWRTRYSCSMYEFECMSLNSEIRTQSITQPAVERSSPSACQAAKIASYHCLCFKPHFVYQVFKAFMVRIVKLSISLQLLLKDVLLLLNATPIKQQQQQQHSQLPS